jgi:hypothetical protein
MKPSEAQLKCMTCADYSFEFRGKKLVFRITVIHLLLNTKGDSLIKDIMRPDKFERSINNSLQSLTKKDVDKYSEAINSVIYFSTLPHKLKDASVNKEFIETKTREL